MMRYASNARNMKKIVLLFMVWAFLLSNNKVSPQEIPQSSSLAPQLSTTQPEYKDKFLAAEIILAHEAHNAYIAEQIKGLVSAKGEKWVRQLAEKGEPIPITGLLANTGLFAHVGLGRIYGRPVVYIDKDIFNDKDDRVDAMRHEGDEIREWEYVRSYLDLPRANMRSWVIKNIDNPDSRLKGSVYEGKTCREIALQIHNGAYPINHLLEKYAPKINIDASYLIELLTRFYGEQRKKGDIYYNSVNSKDFSIKLRQDILDAMHKDNYIFLSEELRRILRQSDANSTELIRFLDICDHAAAEQLRYPIESRYPLLRAVTILKKDEQESLVKILKDRTDFKGLPIVDSILLMLEKSISDSWLKDNAPHLEGRRIYQAASEIWHPAGGLGRVMQFHGLEMNRILAKCGVEYAQIEPYYELGKNNEGIYAELDYAELLGVKPEDIREIDRFYVMVGCQVAEAVWYEVTNKHGIKEYMVKGYKQNEDTAYYTKGLYYYRNSYEPQLVSIEEFSAFFSAATVEFIKRQEEVRANQDQQNYKAPVVHFNDGQMGMAPYFMKSKYGGTILSRATSAYTSHTYYNRVHVGDNMLDELVVPFDDRKYFQHRIAGFRPVNDLTSAGARTADWYGGVSQRHVDDITGYLYDNWGEWSGLNMVAVTNGDAREITAHIFREAMTDVMKNQPFPGVVDVEHPAPELILQAKRLCKQRLGIGLDPDMPVLSYSGRCVGEKSGRKRALTDLNIRKLVESGVQVVIGSNHANDPAILNSLQNLSNSLKSDKALTPEKLPGSFTLLTNIDIETQRAILAASDAQVQDSDPHTEAAGYSEADISACGGIEIAPPWAEGILQSQGAPLDFKNPGAGNTITPDIDLSEQDLENMHRDESIRTRVEAAYLDAILKLFTMGKDAKESLLKLSEYQATSVRLSRVLEARMTSAEYLRQWSQAVAKKEGLAGTSDESLSVDLSHILDGDLKGALDMLSQTQLVGARLKNGMVYAIRCNNDRLSEVPHGVSIVEAYTLLLKMRVAEPKNVVLIYSNKVGLLSVQSYKNRKEFEANNLFGEGDVNVKGSLKEQNIRLINLLNMAFAAANIRLKLPDGYKYDSYERSLLSFISSQYREIYREDISIPEEGIL